MLSWPWSSPKSPKVSSMQVDNRLARIQIKPKLQKLILRASNKVNAVATRDGTKASRDGHRAICWIKTGRNSYVVGSLDEQLLLAPRQRKEFRNLLQFNQPLAFEKVRGHNGAKGKPTAVLAERLSDERSLPWRGLRWTQSARWIGHRASYEPG